MKAFLLAAGLGTRLRPLTDNVPKCLVPVCSKPLLQWWIDLLEQHNITEVLINLHYLSEQVKDFIDSNKTKIKFTCVYEEELLGSAGTLIKNRDFINKNEDFFICYADNLTNYNLSSMLKFHQEKYSLFTMALFETNKPESCGIVEINENNKVISFNEKPSHPKSNLANAGIYIANKKIFNYLPISNLKDIGYDMLPLIINKMYAWKSNKYLIDIGTLGNLDKAEKEWPKILNLK